MSGSFLTPAQRDALDAALALKAAGPRVHPPDHRWALITDHPSHLAPNLALCSDHSSSLQLPALSWPCAWPLAEQKAATHALHKAAPGCDRKSRHGKGTGAAKKGGAGGKYTWGSILTEGIFGCWVVVVGCDTALWGGWGGGWNE